MTPAPMTATPDISALVAELLGLTRDPETGERIDPGEFVPFTVEDADRFRSALLALQSENTTLRARLEEAEKVFAKQEEIADGALSDHDKIRLILRAARRWLEGK